MASDYWNQGSKASKMLHQNASFVIFAIRKNELKVRLELEKHRNKPFLHAFLCLLEEKFAVFYAFIKLWKMGTESIYC